MPVGVRGLAVKEIQNRGRGRIRRRTSKGGARNGHRRKRREDEWRRGTQQRDGVLTAVRAAAVPLQAPPVARYSARGTEARRRRDQTPQGRVGGQASVDLQALGAANWDDWGGLARRARFQGAQLGGCRGGASVTLFSSSSS